MKNKVICSVRKYIKLGFLLIAVSFANAQVPKYIKVQWPNVKEIATLKRNIAYNIQVTDTLALQEQLSYILSQCRELSYLQARFDSVYVATDTVYAHIFLGNSYKWALVRKGNIEVDVLSGSGVSVNAFSSKRFSSNDYAKQANRIITYLENNGYPFASLSLDSVEADSESIKGAFNLQLNNYILWDTIDAIGNADIKKWFLYKYLGIKPQTPYNENNLKLIESRIAQLPYLRVDQKPTVYFYANKAMPVLYLQNRKASSFDGIVGFAPNTAAGTTSASNRLLITGEVNLRLQNIAGTGKTFDLNYRSFLGNSQDVKLKLVWPYILKTNIAFDYELQLLKQDTTFLDVRNQIGLQYRFIGTDYVKLFYQTQNTSLIAVDTNLIKATRRLPDASDIRYNAYGTGLKITRLDYAINPRKGYAFDITAAIGLKNIVRNPTIESLRFINTDGTTMSLYDTLKLRFTQYRLQATAEYFIPLPSALTLRLQTSAGHIEAEGLFINELFRIGGIRTLKGFDEQAIFASTYIIGNIELRYLLQQNSHIMIFWNGAYYENSVRVPKLSDTPQGFGAGLNLETAAGIFSLYYAVGNEFNNPINIGRAKVHFGFVNYF
jgi:hypothetical protein